ncbi:DsbA family oxidoreductase [Longitalea luteola]|uniref:DsbA family oxidoreductase n=1 Tax=Longitalea luteola TaxID=2812563 RepID=UPI001A95FABE|nr:DsbA family protein [Longitalea luteola]
MRSCSQENTTPEIQSGSVIDIVYYTDPLCCWSWALEPQLERLEKDWPGTINWRYCMGGLLPGWQHYFDQQNSIQRPAQMGPLWMHASEVMEVPIAHRIWVDDPPASSYPACIAVKCAALQSAEAGRLYLYHVRKAVMFHSLNIARPEVLLQVARCIAVMNKQFSFEQFEEDMKTDRGLEAFRKDLQEVKYRGINRFPTLLIKRPAAPGGLLVTGFRPAETLLHIVNEANGK